VAGTRDAMTPRQWMVFCTFMHTMLQDEGNENFKAMLREQIDSARQNDPILLEAQLRAWMGK